MRYTTDPHIDVVDDKLMLRNYSKLLSFEAPNKTTIQVKFERTIAGLSNLPFTYFTRTIADGYSPYILNEGDIFSPISNKNIYYIILEGSPNQIPNLKSVEVLLTERGLSLEDIKLLEDAEIADIIAYDNGNQPEPSMPNIPGVKVPEVLKDKVAKAGGGGGGGGSAPPKVTPDKESEWTPDMSLTSISEQFAELAATAASAEGLLEASLNQMQNVVDMAVADSNEAQAEAEAATAAANAAIATANAAQAEAELAKAQFDANNGTT